jgi:hypothetical protein
VAAYLLALGAVKVEGTIVNQVHKAYQLILQSNWKLHGSTVMPELLLDLAYHLPGAGTGAVTLVDERKAGNIVAAHLTINGDRLRLHPSCTAAQTRVSCY